MTCWPRRLSTEETTLSSSTFSLVTRRLLASAHPPCGHTCERGTWRAAMASSQSLVGGCRPCLSLARLLPLAAARRVRAQEFALALVSRSMTKPRSSSCSDPSTRGGTQSRRRRTYIPECSSSRRGWVVPARGRSLTPLALSYGTLASHTLRDSPRSSLLAKACRRLGIC